MEDGMDLDIRQGRTTSKIKQTGKTSQKNKKDAGWSSGLKNLNAYFLLEQDWVWLMTCRPASELEQPHSGFGLLTQSQSTIKQTE